METGESIYSGESGRNTLAAKTDVAVIGGGPAGAATGLSLAQAGLSVTVIERSAQPALHAGETLPPRVRLALERLGVWDDFIAAGHLPCAGNRSVWGGDEPFDRDFLFDPYGAGWHVDRLRFDQMLRDAAARAGAVVASGYYLKDCAPDASGGWRLELSAGDERATLNARFVVDASGRAAVFARRCGAMRRAVDRLVGVVCYFDASREGSGGRLTLIEAAEHGWWYSACLPGDKIVAVFMTDADTAAARQVRTAEGWLALLEQTSQTGEHIASFGARLVSAPRIVTAHSSCLTAVASPSWLAVGDAAATYDPLSSQGIATALDSALEASSAIQARFGGASSERAGALAGYAQNLASAFSGYLAKRAAYYSLERRWPESAFWRRRRETAARAAK